MPGLEGDLELGKPKRSMSPEAKQRVTLTSRVCISQGHPRAQALFVLLFPTVLLFHAHINIHCLVCVE